MPRTTGVALPIPWTSTRYGSGESRAPGPLATLRWGGAADVPLPWSRLGSYDIIHAGATGCSHANGIPGLSRMCWFSGAEGPEEGHWESGEVVS